MADELEQRGINVIRGLAMDAVQKANSGHPGTPMALAPLAHVLWTRIMKYDASAPDWPDRDRFVLSAGHASMLLYSMLYLTGYGLELDDLRQFRQWGSRTPGHPEYRHTNGVEVTTGPLGQGFANAVGFAIDEKHLRERFGADICDHRIFGICSDGDFMEGISHEGASLAGHLRLGRMVFVYDDNHITIDGPTELAYSDDVPKRFEAYGWHVVRLGEVANDLDAIEAGARAGVEEQTRPTLVVLRSHIGYPSPKAQDTAAAHGNPLGADEVAKVKEILGLPPVDFFAPDDVLLWYREAGRRGAAIREAWAAQPKPDEYDACLSGSGLHGWEQKLPTWQVGASLATRTAIEEVLTAVVDVVPGLFTASGDLTGNTGMQVKSLRTFTPEDATGRLIHFGIREHAMGAAANGMAVSGLVPCVGTFFVFSDYMRPAVRLAAIMQAKVCFVWTHDSVGVGEDGPTHQPVEQLASLRAMPGLRLIRPADANEVAAAWKVHLDGDGPTALLLTRQKVPVLDGTAERAPAGVPAGAYVLAPEGAARPDVVLISTGSEVQVCIAAREQLATRGIAARVVSMPSWYLFEQQPDDYRADVLPSGVPTLAVEAGVRFGWERYADDVVSIDRFGASAPGEIVMRELGITPEHAVERALALLGAVGAGGS
ncbi:MAG: transketolase [Actinomycetota bacterium]|nr:transketolase [Actinomycetota bacterium]